MTTPQLSAMNRLKRAGDPASPTNAKLRAATQEMADYIVSVAEPRGLMDLPRGYFIGGHGALVLSALPHVSIEISGQSTLSVLHKFAADVAAGLIEEIERNAKNQKADATSR